MYVKREATALELYEIENTDLGRRLIANLGLIVSSARLAEYFGKQLEAAYGHKQLWEQKLLCTMEWEFLVSDAEVNQFLELFNAYSRNFWIENVSLCKAHVMHGEDGFSFNWELHVNISDSDDPLIVKAYVKSTLTEIQELTFCARENAREHKYWTYLKLLYNE